MKKNSQNGSLFLHMLETRMNFNENNTHLKCPHMSESRIYRILNVFIDTVIAI